MQTSTVLHLLLVAVCVFVCLTKSHRQNRSSVPEALFAIRSLAVCRSPESVVVFERHGRVDVRRYRRNSFTRLNETERFYKLGLVSLVTTIPHNDFRLVSTVDYDTASLLHSLIYSMPCTRTAAHTTQQKLRNESDESRCEFIIEMTFKMQ